MRRSHLGTAARTQTEMRLRALLLRQMKTVPVRNQSMGEVRQASTAQHRHRCRHTKHYNKHDTLHSAWTARYSAPQQQHSSSLEALEGQQRLIVQHPLQHLQHVYCPAIVGSHTA